MDWMDGAVFDVLRFLAPGFIAAWVLFGLTAERRLSDLQRIVQALIFSIFVKLVVGGIAWLLTEFWRWRNFGPWNYSIELAWSVVVALVLGFVLSWLVNTDRLYVLLRRVRITTQTSRPSVWYSAFSDHQDTYVVLQLRDDRRVQGWPAEWPSVVGEGHIKLEDPVWLSMVDGKQIETPLLGSAFILFPIEDIRWIEFQPRDSSAVPAAEERSHEESAAAPQLTAIP